MFGLFGKKLPAFDPAEGNAFTPQGLRLIETGQGAALGNLFADLPPADRIHFIDGLGQVSEIGAPLPPVSQHPAMAAVEGGLRYVWAHRLRGFAVADQTSQKQVRDMIEMAAKASEVLEEAAASTPGDSAVHAFRIRNGMLTSAGEEGIETFERDLRQTGEANVLAEMARLNYWAPKWYGSVEEMHARADDMTADPPNAAFLALKARSFIEEWLYESGMNDEDGAAAAMKARAATPEFKSALAALDDRFHALAGSGPALSPAEAHFARNQFAFLFTAFINKDRLARHLAQLQHPAATPWGYMADTGRIPHLIARLRKECGLPRR